MKNPEELSLALEGAARTLNSVYAIMDLVLDAFNEEMPSVQKDDPAKAYLERIRAVFLPALYQAQEQVGIMEKLIGEAALEVNKE